jgi:hypothetical protein
LAQVQKESRMDEQIRFAELWKGKEGKWKEKWREVDKSDK